MCTQQHIVKIVRETYNNSTRKEQKGRSGNRKQLLDTIPSKRLDTRDHPHRKTEMDAQR